MLSDPYGSAETPWMSVIAAKLRRLIYGDFFIYRNRMKILKKDCLGKRQPSLKPVNLAGYRRRTAIWFKKETQHQNIYLKGIMYEHSFFKKDNLNPYCLLYGLLHDCLQFRQQFTV